MASCPFIPPALSPSSVTHRATLGCPLAAEMALHVFGGEKVTGAEWAGGRNGSLVGLGQAWVPPQLRSRPPAPAQSPHPTHPSSQGQAMLCSPACSPSSQAQGHTHWFSSRSRVKLELKAGMTKLTWARWTGWGWGEGRGRVNLGRPEGGNWGIRGTPEQGEGRAQSSS